MCTWPMVNDHVLCKAAAIQDGMCWFHTFFQFILKINMDGLKTKEWVVCKEHTCDWQTLDLLFLC